MTLILKWTQRRTLVARAMSSMLRRAVVPGIAGVRVSAGKYSEKSMSVWRVPSANASAVVYSVPMKR